MNLKSKYIVILFLNIKYIVNKNPQSVIMGCYEDEHFVCQM